jgi:hypothetical protein
MSRNFFLIRGKTRGGGQAEDQIVFENQVGPAIVRIMTREDIDHLEIYCTDEIAWMRQQKRRRDEERGRQGV